MLEVKGERMRHFTALSMLCLLSLPAFAEEPAARACEYAVVRPLPSALCVAARADEFEKELARIREALPKVTVIGLVFDINASKKEDWIRLLDACRARGFKAVVQFSESGHDQPDWAYRPLKSEGGWNWSNLGEFVATRECIAHPALHSVFMIDEPWHHQKKPQYPTDDLKAMYADLKSRAPEGASFRIMAQFSREIGKKAKSKGPCRWEKGMCDIAMISALEFQDGEYQKAMLDENHEASRRIIHEATPGMPVWTTVQTLGRCYGPSPGLLVSAGEGRDERLPAHSSGHHPREAREDTSALRRDVSGLGFRNRRAKAESIHARRPRCGRRSGLAEGGGGGSAG